MQVVLFDLDDTLIIESATARASFRSVGELVPGVDPDAFATVIEETARARWQAMAAHSICVELGVASWEGLWATFEGSHSVLDEVRRLAPEYRGQSWRSALLRVGITDATLADTLEEQFISAERSGHSPIAGAGDVVRRLSEHHRLGLLTNGPPDIQRHKLERSGCAPYFDSVQISGEVGIGKPDPRAFTRVLDQLGVEPANAVMVGDSWERDVLGARAAGVTPIWIASGRQPPVGVGGVAIADRIEDVPVLIASVESASVD